MTRRGRARGVVVAAVMLSLAACGVLPTGPKPGSVTIYGRAAPDGESWFGLFPPGDPPSVVGFGADGVGCLDGQPGTQIAWYDGAPADGASPRQIIGQIPADGSPVVLWVEIGIDGQLRVGPGVPPWWVGEAQVC